jgi:hypothetical protein
VKSPGPLVSAMWCIIAGWLAVALFIAVELLSGILEHRNADREPADVQHDDQAERQLVCSSNGQASF